jgi:diguanylate cyclase (GGDEF)-like protein
MSKPIILIVDDDPTSIEVMGQVLKDIAEIHFAASGRDAMGQVLQDRPDLVLLDVMMPDLDGFAVCEALKADPRTHDIPVVFVTAATDEAEEARGLLAGAVEYVTKPIRPALLAARVRNLLELKRRRDHVTLEPSVDDVTGLASRRQLEEAMVSEWRRAARAGRPLSFALIAIDDLQPVEALFGSRAVSDYLRRVGETLAVALHNPGDLVTRFSVDRFAVLLPESDEAGAEAAAARMRTAVAQLGLPAARGPGVHIKVTVGAATAFPAAAPSPTDLITQASRRLDEAVRLSDSDSGGPHSDSAAALTTGAPQRRPAGDVGCQAGRVFIVDDDPTSVDVLSELALQGGYEVAVASDGAQALAIVAAEKPDVILLDVEMPGIDGFEACRRMKAAASTRDIPVIFLSGLTDAAEKLRAFAVGGADYVGKPFEPKEVLARVAHQIKITRLQAEMRSANERLLELDRLKATFAAMLVHDLRSPLTVVQTTLGFLKEHPFRDDPELGEMVEFSGEAMDKALALIAEVLEIYRSDRAQAPAHLVAGDAAEVLRRCGTAAQLEARRRAVVVETRIHGPLLARIDSQRLERAVTNLLGNALKFSSRGGRVSLEAGVVTDAAGAPRIHIEVRDTGDGIPEAELPHVFELYRQVNRFARTGGVGLGLAIVKRIVDAHGGTVAVRSQLGIGSAFVIELPALEQIPRDVAAAPSLLVPTA